MTVGQPRMPHRASGTRRGASLLVAALSAWALAACSGGSDPDAAARVPADASPTGDATRGGQQAAAASEARIESIIARMDQRDKVGQLVMAEIRSVSPDEVWQYRLGGILNGGGSFPGGDRRASAQDWLELAMRFHDASVDREDGRPRIPVIWGTDAVHGHNNVYGATLFPHNIGLGASRNAELLRQVAEATAAEVAATGIVWTFAPTIAVPRDDRWGRTYEGLSEDPALVARLGAALVEGFQGRLGDEFMGAGRVLATAKHFIGDGGTADGIDQGDTHLAEPELMAVHGASYISALAAGAQTVMASFSSWNGEKMHGQRYLLTEVLKTRMGFDGFVIGDWNGHEQLPGCSAESCVAAINAGVDMIMVPAAWRAFFDNTLHQLRDGHISTARLDDAVRRILRVKMRAGLLDADGEPGDGPRGLAGAGDASRIGSAAHRALARQAARESLVLLKNAGAVLPLKSDARVLVAGEAKNVPMQLGGWSVTWQGTDTSDADFPHAVSIFAGVRAALAAGGGAVEFSAEGAYDTRPDAAIVVFGETPYAEGPGDIDTLEFSPNDKGHLAIMRALAAADIPVIAIFLSGRPLWVNPELNAADAFIAAWLPGSQAGAGIADALFCAPADWARCGISGRLGFSWPARADQFSLNVGEASADAALFPVGYGLRYGQARAWTPLTEQVARSGLGDIGRTLFLGRGLAPFKARLQEGERSMVSLDRHATRTQSGALSAEIFNRKTQEDSVRVRFGGAQTKRWRLDSGRAHDWRDEAERGAALALDIRVLAAAAAPLAAVMRCGDACSGSLALSGMLSAQVGGDWFTLGMPLRCFAAAGVDLEHVTGPLAIESEGSWHIELSRLRLAQAADIDPKRRIACE